MASTYSPDLRIELIGNGEQSGYWGTTTNNNLGTLIEQAIAKTATTTLTSSVLWFRADDGVEDVARCAAVDVSVDGTIIADFTAYIPPVPKLYVVKNSSAFVMTLRAATTVNSSTSAGGTTVVIPVGKTLLVRCTGTNLYSQFDYINGNLKISGDLAVDGGTTVTGSITLGGSIAAGARISGTYTQTLFVVIVNTSTDHKFINGETVAFINTSGLAVSGAYVITYISTTSFSFVSAVSQSTSGNCLLTNDAITLNGIITPGAIIEGSSTIPALRITQTGSGLALLVEDTVNPDSTPFVIDAAGKVVVGNTTAIADFVNPQTGANNVSPTLQSDAASVAGSSLGLSSWFTSTAQSGGVLIAKSISGTVGTHTALTAETSVGSVSWQGSDGTSFIRTAQIDAVVDGTPGTNDMPGRLVFSTTADGASSPTERVRVSSTGNVIVGSGEASATPVGNTLRAPNAAGTDISGSNLIITAGNSTGTGTSGYVSIQTSNPSTTGSTANTLIDRLKIQADGLMLGQYSTMGAGVVPSESFYRLSSDFVGTPSVATAQSLFGVGITLAANTTYAFEMVFAMTKTASTTSHTLSLALDIGSGTISNVTYQTLGLATNSTTISAVTAPDAFSVIQTASATVVTGAIASSAASYMARVVGTLTVGTSGIFTPQYKTSVSVAGAYTTVAGSFIRMYPVTTGSSVNVGGWA